MIKMHNRHFSGETMNAVDKLEYLEKKVNELLDKGIEQFLEPYIEGEPLYIYIQGWTPDFNDGEPCLHSVDWCEGKEIVEYEHHEANPSIFEGITAEELENSREVISVDDQHFSNYRKAIDAVIKYCDYKYETNYHCLIICKDNNLTMIKEEYDCGY